MLVLFPVPPPARLVRFYRGFYRGGECPFPRKGKVREGGERRSPAPLRFRSRFYSGVKDLAAGPLKEASLVNVLKVKGKRASRAQPRAGDLARDL